MQTVGRRVNKCGRSIADQWPMEAVGSGPNLLSMSGLNRRRLGLAEQVFEKLFTCRLH
ncbi:unnamed protein product, partial [Protopolystoma xenopodis]